MAKYLGVLVLLVGALCLIYAGVNPAYDNNIMLGTGLSLVVAGYVVHIILNAKLGKQAESESK